MQAPDCGRPPAVSVEELVPLVEQLAARVAAAYPVLVREGAVEDIVQTTHLKVLAWVASGRPVRNPKAWICSIARRSAIDYLRNPDRCRLRDIVSEIDWADAIPDVRLDPLEAAALRRGAELSAGSPQEESAVTELLASAGGRFCASPAQLARYLTWLGVDTPQDHRGVEDSTFSRAVRSAEEWATAGAIIVVAESCTPELCSLIVSPAIAARRPFNAGMMRKFDIIRRMPLDWSKLRRGFEMTWDAATTTLFDLLESASLTLHPRELDVIRTCEWVLCLSARVYRDEFRSAFADLWSELSARRSLVNADVRRTIATVGGYAACDDHQCEFLSNEELWNAEVSNVLAYIASARRDNRYPVHLTFLGEPQVLIDADRQAGLPLHAELASYAIACIQSPRYDQSGLNNMILVWVDRVLREARAQRRVVAPIGIRSILEANESKLRAANAHLFEQVICEAHRYEIESQDWQTA